MADTIHGSRMQSEFDSRSNSVLALCSSAAGRVLLVPANRGAMGVQRARTISVERKTTTRIHGSTAADKEHSTPLHLFSLLAACTTRHTPQPRSERNCWHGGRVAKHLPGSDSVKALRRGPLAALRQAQPSACCHRLSTRRVGMHQSNSLVAQCFAFSCLCKIKHAVHYALRPPASSTGMLRLIA
jgi:hypothetical protein